MSVLIVANVVGGAVVSGYRRIGILKSLGFTPAQVALAYAAQVALPALVGCLLGVVAGNLLATPLLRQNADVYGVGRLGVPIWVDVAVPVGICALAARRRAPAGAARRAAQHRSGDRDRTRAAERARLRRAPAARPHAAAPPDHDRARRPVRATRAHAPDARRRPARRDRRHVRRRADLVAEARGQRDLAPGRPSRCRSRCPATGARPAPSASRSGHRAARPGAAAVTRRRRAARSWPPSHAQPATLHVVAEADDSVERRRALAAGSGDGVPRPGRPGPATTSSAATGTRARTRSLVPTGFLTQTGTSVGDTIAIGQGRNRLRVRIVGEVFDTHDRGLNIVTSWATLRAIDPGLAPDQFDVGLRPGHVGHRLRERGQPQARPRLSRRAERPRPRGRRRDDRPDRHARRCSSPRSPRSAS